DPGRGRRYEGFGKCARRFRAALEAFDFLRDSAGVYVFDIRPRLGCILHAAASGKASNEAFCEFREFLKVPAAPALRFTRKAGHPLWHIGLEPDPLLLTVVADVDACLRLFLDYTFYGVVHLGRQLLFVYRLPFLALNQQIRQRFAAGQTSDMSGEDS